MQDGEQSKLKFAFKLFDVSALEPITQKRNIKPKAQAVRPMY